jgi:hypothetical protein
MSKAETKEKKGRTMNESFQKRAQRMREAKCVGRQGDWLVNVTMGGRTHMLASAHNEFVKGEWYERPDIEWLGGKNVGKGGRWLGALSQRMVVVTLDESDGKGTKRKGYVGVFEIGEPSISAKGIRFRLMRQVGQCV